MKLFNLPIEVYFDEDVYIAKCNIIQGAFASGNTPQEAIKELEDVVNMILDSKKTRLSDEFSIQTNKFFTYIPIVNKGVFCEE